MINPLSLANLNPHKYPLTPEIEANLNALVVRLNDLQQAFGKQFIISSGLRSEAQQEGLIKAGRSHASNSKHLTGQAADILDPNGTLKIWIMANLSLTDNLWFEAFSYTNGWVHGQIVPPASGKKFFIP